MDQRIHDKCIDTQVQPIFWYGYTVSTRGVKGLKIIVNGIIDQASLRKRDVEVRKVYCQLHASSIVALRGGQRTTTWSVFMSHDEDAVQMCELYHNSYSKWLRDW